MVPKPMGKNEVRTNIIRESDSPWGSNVVMVPKPMGKNELRTNTKADYQTGSQNTAQHYRICLDFRDLNKILDFPQQVAFPTIDKFLHKLKGKYVVTWTYYQRFT
jgi:negative regulator of genetic competence, sporulation and motility